LLGLHLDPISHWVESALWDRDHFEIRLGSVSASESWVLVLEASHPGQRAFLVGPEVSLWSREKALPDHLAQRLRKVAARNLAKLRFEDLRKAVLLDPEAVAEQEPVDAPAPDGISTASAAEHAFTHPALFADFFAASELRRAGCDIIDVHSAHSLVCHGDVECAYCAVTVPRPRNGLLRLPVYETVRNVGRLPRGAGAFDESENLTDITCSDMTEQDVILGAPGKLTAALRDADRKKKHDALLVVGLCVPDVIGENEQAVVQAYQATTETPILTVPASPRSWGWLAQDMLDRRRAAHDDDGPADKSAINLVGFGRNLGTEELRDRLCDLGIRVQEQVIPELAMASIGRLHRAALNVYLPNVHWGRAYDHLKRDRGRAHVEFDGPYGFEGTTRWLGRVCEALGMGESARVHTMDDVHGEKWGRLRELARHHRLGLVVPGTDLDTLTDARRTWGIPLATFLTEMGFGLDVFVALPVSGDMSRLQAHLGVAEHDVSLTKVDSLAGLLDALTHSPCEAVFSSYVFDWRLVRSGKMPFSTLELEMGYRGAVASLERLLTLCRTPLFRAGRRFLGGIAPEGWGHGS
jgi:hypothetical protein